MNKPLILRRYLPFFLVAFVVILNFFIITRVSGLAYTPFNWVKYQTLYGVDLTSFTVYEDENYVFGYVDTPDIPITLRLMRGGSLVQQLNTSASGTYFNAYFLELIRGGDTIEIDMPDTETISVYVDPLVININKATDVFSGSAPPNSSLYAMVFSYSQWQWFYSYPLANAGGSFSYDFTSQVDVFLGDGAELWYYNPDGYRIVRRNYRVPGMTVYPLSNYVNGYVEPDATVNVTLKNNAGAVKESGTALADDAGYFFFYFETAAIEIGDRVEIQYGALPLQSITMVNLTIDSIDPDTDLVSGAVPANSKVDVYVSDAYQGSNATKIVTANASGRYTADFSVAFVRSGAAPAEEVEPLLRSSGRTSAPDESQSVPDRQQVLPENAVPELTRPQPESALRKSPVDGNPALSPTRYARAQDRHPLSEGGVELSVSLPEPGEALTEEAALLDTFDILPGSYGRPTYHDAQDNQIRVNYLYAGPYLRVTPNSYWGSEAFLTGPPSETFQATLRNSLGAIIGTASGSLNDYGYSYIDFYDSASGYVPIETFNRVEVTFQGGEVHTLDIVDIDYIIDRDADFVYGTGPANTELRLNYSGGDEIYDVTTDASGDFSQLFDYLIGSYSFNVYYRTPQGDDAIYYSRVPQFTIYPDEWSVEGIGPADTPVVAELRDAHGVVKDTASTIVYEWGNYYLYFDEAIDVGDVVAVDLGPLHYEQAVVALTIAGDTENNIVYGTAPPRAWLNVFAEGYFGPYYHYDYRYFSADTGGNYAAAFSEVRGGDQMQVIFWQDGHRDRVSIYGYVPYLYISATRDEVSGNSDPGAEGTITLRNSSGGIKDSASVTASDPYGYFYFPTDVDVVTGDDVEVQLGVLDQTSDVIPLSGAINLTNDTVSGASLPNTTIGVSAFHWNGSYYADWTEDGGELTRFVTTNASGSYSINFSAEADLQSGDYLELYYIGAQDTQYFADFFTTSPTVEVLEYPSDVPPASRVEVLVNLANGAHPDGVYIAWDTVSHDEDMNYSNWSGWIEGAIGQNLLTFTAPARGNIFFRAFAWVDGQWINSAQEYMIQVNATNATVLYDPVSGTTNDSTPSIYGVTAQNASVTLYDGSATVMTTSSDSSGYFVFNLSTPLSEGYHSFTAVATVSGSPGPVSNRLQLWVDSSLPVDPVHILITSRGVTQHLRDDSGFANLGGRIWTRTGDSVTISIPVSVAAYNPELYVGGVLDSAMLDAGDGIYIGTYTPPTSGEYALDLKYRLGGPSGTQVTINILTGLIDPDGYVYDAALGEDYRLAGATVTCYELVDEDSDTWLLWEAAIWDQVNPQVVGSDGYYAFFTLPGQYKIVVTYPGYYTFESPVLTVVDEPVHYNVPMWMLQEIFLPMITH